jgi:hypothetical protein
MAVNIGISTLEWNGAAVVIIIIIIIIIIIVVVVVVGGGGGGAFMFLFRALFQVLTSLVTDVTTRST